MKHRKLNIRNRQSGGFVFLMLFCFAILSGGCNKKADTPPAGDLAPLVKKAEANDFEAQVLLGERYLDGVGVEKDLAKAKIWFETAANSGRADAKYQLGRMYAVGLGLPKDENKAFTLFGESAAKGDRDGIHALGLSYYIGTGTQQDLKKAIELWERSAALGKIRSEHYLGRAYELDGPSHDFKKAIEWYEKAIVHGNTDAIVDLSEMYRDGRGVSKDLQRAVSLLQKGADANNSFAQYSLGFMYSKGLGVQLDLAKALDLWMRAAESGDSNAQYEVGLAFLSGSSVPKDTSKAADWFLKAARQGNKLAQEAIGYLYATGEGVSKDLVLAYAWVNVASTFGGKDAQSNRDKFESQLTHDEKSEAQRLSSGWKVGAEMVREGAASASRSPKLGPNEKLTKRGAGTAFFVSKTGQAITNHHVVVGCTEVRQEGRDGAVRVKASDLVNDLALLETSQQVSQAAPIIGDPAKLRQGDDVVVFGFPLNTVLSSGGNLTPGVISALTGLGNNTSQIQITAPIQPGSSGSPVLNKKGEVVGVVSMKLSDAKMASATGSVGQSVNFAIGGQTLRAFISTQQVDFSTGTFSFFEKPAADLADEARKWTFVVECWK